MGRWEQVAHTECPRGLPPTPSSSSMTCGKIPEPTALLPSPGSFASCYVTPNNSLTFLSPNSLIWKMREPCLPHKVVVRMEWRNMDQPQCPSLTPPPQEKPEV